MLTLHHFTSPRWFAEKGGFTQSGAAEKFAAYVSSVIEAFGPRIPLWCTINEPMVLVAGSYLGPLAHARSVLPSSVTMSS
jgi:beta-glucosidase